MSGPYKDNIPNSTDSMQLSCQQIRGNFTQIYNAYSENHIPVTDLMDDNTGMHTQLEMVQQSGDPATLSDEVGLYSKAGTGSQPQIFFRPSSSATAIQISNDKVISVLDDPVKPNYQSFFAGPYIVLFGLIKQAVNGQAIVYSTYYPGITFSEVQYVGLQYKGSSTNRAVLHIGPISITNLQFNLFIQGPDPKFDFYYVIIGKP